MSSLNLAQAPSRTTAAIDLQQKRKRNTKKRIMAALFYIGATTLVLVWLIPVFIAVFTAGKSMNELMSTPHMWSIPQEWTWDNFAAAWTRAGMSRYMFNSFMITVPSVVGTLAIASLGAFALAFYRFKLNHTILIVFVAGMLIPFQMLMIPVFRMSDSLGLINTYRGVSLFHISFQLGFCVYFLRNFLRTLPFSLIEATRMDGARDLTIFFRIIMPLALPSLAALAVLEFTWIWNDLLWSLVLLNQNRVMTVTQGLANMQGQFITNYNIIAAGSILAAIPPLIVFLLFQRFFISGLTVGAEKG
ncbi:carbohydrate ABC transporter permease [Spirochaeta africana]|uniref:sn-glycerol-3-phosphate transport system permease protein UgpE n=1 Tax=Spirochaeta africana (strain ATCC 700263 / DSM 8902 / Z-7692) TaxID=889378 RepID=H9UHP3_SPIAZ|nr:carbohydrate ABC transporter permease [Spirochaeta africana]AFG37036.1 ABC-type sugar transport system, permease component [Spirochaeta africana DSM 8902]